MLFQECFTFVSNVFPGSSKQVSRVFQGNLEEMSRKFQGFSKIFLKDGVLFWKVCC